VTTVVSFYLDYLCCKIHTQDEAAMATQGTAPDPIPGLKIRRATLADVSECARICYEAFGAINKQHNFPPDFPAPEVPAMDRAAERNFAGVRLVQAAFHNRSLSLYTKLGFDPREPLSCVQGPAINRRMPGYTIRRAEMPDLEACNALCFRVHGHHRGGELRDAIQEGSAMVAVSNPEKNNAGSDTETNTAASAASSRNAEHNPRIVAYSSAMAFFGHAVAETNAALQALIAAAPEFGGPGILVPTRNAALLRWCLESGLRITQPMTLMTMGLYNEPTGAYLPSILF
jgi:hypothetical protein